MVAYLGQSGEAQDIIDCASTVLESVQGTIPYLRDAGMPDDMIGRAAAEAEGIFINFAIDQIEGWDDRCLVEQIECVIDGEKIKPKVVLTDGE